MRRIALVAAFALAIAGIGRAAAEEDRRPAPENFDEVEEQMLREQIERFLNAGARWDADQRRIVFREKMRELEGLEGPISVIAGRLVIPDEGGRLRIRDGVRLRPFAMVIRDYLADGGLEDIEKFQRFRDGGENPFEDGIPPRVMKAIAGLMKALNEQDFQALGDRDRDRDRDRDERRDREGRERRRRAEAREMEPLDGAAPRSLRDEAARRLHIDPEDLEARLREAARLARQAEREIARIRKELDRRLDELGVRDRVRGMGRDLENEVRRYLESEDFERRLGEIERRAMDFWNSERGRELQRRAFEFFESDRGKKLQRRIEDFLRSEDGRRFARRLGDLFDRGPRRDDEARPPGREPREREERREAAPYRPRRRGEGDEAPRRGRTRLF